MGLVNGLGNEEVGQAGSEVASLWLTGSVTSFSNKIVGGVYNIDSSAGATGTMSGLTISGGIVVSIA